MSAIQLSYILTTYNKLDYLKITLPYLIEACQPDEEIVITDGGSTDGTIEFLSSLLKDGKIHQFISARDYGEAHGTNKAILMARGELIKIITDDDVFFYPAIQECKSFMLSHQSVDVLAGNIGIMELGKPNVVCVANEFENAFREWYKDGSTAFFCGLSLMLRKSSLPYTGLFFTGFIQIDLEFSARITKLKTNIAWYTPVMLVAIRNPSSNFTNMALESSFAEQRRVGYFYGWKNYHRKIRIIDKIKDAFRPLKNILVGKSKYIGNKNYEISGDVMGGFKTERELIVPYLAANFWLHDFKNSGDSNFIFKDNIVGDKIQK